MAHIYHLNCGILQRNGGPEAWCHCILIEDNNELILVDTGIGLQDVLHPEERIGRNLIEMAGFQFHSELTALKQIEKLGFDASQVKHCIITHLDPDHIGGLADFPKSRVHVSSQEYESFMEGIPRYLPVQLAHEPELKLYSRFDYKWFGFNTARIEIPGHTQIVLVPLPGHTLGHCGIAILEGHHWLFYVGDAYGLRVELSDANHPASEIARINAMNDQMRIETLERLKKLTTEFPAQIRMFGYHDPSEFSLFEKKQFEKDGGPAMNRA